MSDHNAISFTFDYEKIHNSNEPSITTPKLFKLINLEIPEVFDFYNNFVEEYLDKYSRDICDYKTSTDQNSIDKYHELFSELIKKAEQETQMFQESISRKNEHKSKNNKPWFTPGLKLIKTQIFINFHMNS